MFILKVCPCQQIATLYNIVAKAMSRWCSEREKMWCVQTERWGDRLTVRAPGFSAVGKFNCLSGYACSCTICLVKTFLPISPCLGLFDLSPNYPLLFIPTPSRVKNGFHDKTGSTAFELDEDIFHLLSSEMLSLRKLLQGLDSANPSP